MAKGNLRALIKFLEMGVKDKLWLRYLRDHIFQWEKEERTGMFDSSNDQEDSPSTQLGPRDKRKKIATEREYIFFCFNLL